MKHLICSLLTVSLLASATTDAKCSSSSTRERFSNAASVVLVTITAARDGPVPWPFGLDPGASLPGRILDLHILRSWKGSLHPGDDTFGWTPAPRSEDSYFHTEIGTQFVVFFYSDSSREIEACNASSPERADKTSRELDALTFRGKLHVDPNKRWSGYDTE